MSLVFDFGQGLRCGLSMALPLSLNYGGLICFLATSSSFLCAGTLSPKGKCCNFFAGGLIGVDKHLFQRVSRITSMTLPLNYIFVLLFANIDVIPKQKQLSTV